VKLIFEDIEREYLGAIELRDGRLMFDDFTTEMRKITPRDAQGEPVSPDAQPVRWFYLLGVHFRTPYTTVRLEDDEGNRVPREEYIRLYEEAAKGFPAS
jgi:hypothetical protein